MKPKSHTFTCPIRDCAAEMTTTPGRGVACPRCKRWFTVNKDGDRRELDSDEIPVEIPADLLEPSPGTVRVLQLVTDIVADGLALAPAPPTPPTPPAAHEAPVGVRQTRSKLFVPAIEILDSQPAPAAPRVKKVRAPRKPSKPKPPLRVMKLQLAPPGTLLPAEALWDDEVFPSWTSFRVVLDPPPLPGATHGGVLLPTGEPGTHHGILKPFLSRNLAPKNKLGRGRRGD